MLYQEAVRNDTCFLLLNLCNSLLYSCQISITWTDTYNAACFLTQLKKCGFAISGNDDHLLLLKYYKIKSPIISLEILKKKKSS